MADGEVREPVTRERAVRVAIDARRRRRHRVAEHAQTRSRARDRGDVALLPREEQERSARRHARRRLLRVRRPRRRATQWRRGLEERAVSTRDVLARHPWAISIKARTSPGPGDPRTPRLGHRLPDGRRILDADGRPRDVARRQLRPGFRPAGGDAAAGPHRGYRRCDRGHHRAAGEYAGCVPEPRRHGRRA